jgi:hypothetical protein
MIILFKKSLVVGPRPALAAAKLLKPLKVIKKITNLIPGSWVSAEAANQDDHQITEFWSPRLRSGQAQVGQQEHSYKPQATSHKFEPAIPIRLQQLSPLEHRR